MECLCGLTFRPASLCQSHCTRRGFCHPFEPVGIKQCPIVADDPHVLNMFLIGCVAGATMYPALVLFARCRVR